MKFIRIITSLCFVFFLSAVVAQSSDSLQLKERQLKAKLEHTSGGDRLAVIYDLSSLYWDVPKEEYWLRRLYSESIRMDSLRVAEHALSGLARYYHNNEQLNNLIVCSQRSDSIAHLRNTYSNQYFGVKSFLCKRYIWDEHYDEAIYLAKMMLDTALEHRNIAGQEECEELMGLIYQMMGRDAKAAPFFLKAYQLQLDYNPKEYSALAQLITNLIEVNLKLNQLQEVKMWIGKFEKIQADVRKGVYGNVVDFPYARNEKLMSVYSADCFLRAHDLTAMKRALDKADVIRESDVYVDFLLNYAHARYANASMRYDEALKYINLVIEADGGNTIEYRTFRADLYEKLNKNLEALQEYRICLQIQRDSSHMALDRQIADIQHIQQTKRLEIKIRDNEIAMRRMKNKQLVFAVSFLLFVAIVLGISLYRSRRFQKILYKKNKDLRRMEVVLNAALKRANEVDRLKTSFLHHVSHEIRTPLNSIIGFSDILANDPACHPNEECGQYCVIIKENSRMLLDLVTKMIEVSKYEASQDQTRASLSSCNLHEICMKAIDQLRNSNHLKAGVDLQVNGDEQVQVVTSCMMLKEVIFNLLDNAANHTEQGTITLAYAIKRDLGVVEFSVTDTGEGIDDQVRKRLFQEFEKGNDFSPGMGLGLALCRILVKQFGGEIYLDNKYRSGARFVFTHSLGLKAATFE